MQLNALILVISAVNKLIIGVAFLATFFLHLSNSHPATCLILGQIGRSSHSFFSVWNRRARHSCLSSSGVESNNGGCFAFCASRAFKDFCSRQSHSGWSGTPCITMDCLEIRAEEQERAFLEHESEVKNGLRVAAWRAQLLFANSFDWWSLCEAQLNSGDVICGWCHLSIKEIVYRQLIDLGVCSIYRTIGGINGTYS